MPNPFGQPAALRDRRLWPFLILIVLIAAALRLLPLPHEALSGDELFSRRMVVEPAMQGWQDVRVDLVHPPLYYIVLKAATGVWGSGVWGLRMLSVVCGLLTLPLLAVLGDKLPGARWSGLLAAACVAVGRSDLYYSQEARSYAMYTFCVLLLLLWMTGLEDSERRRPGYWLLGCGLMTVLVYTHYVGGVFVALAVFSVLISRVPRSSKLRVLGCGVGALLLFLPWLLGEAGVYRAKHGIGENLDWQGHPGFYDLRQVWATAVGVNSFPAATTVALLVLVCLSAAALGFLARRRELGRAPVVLALACMGWLAPLIVFGLSEPPINLPLFAQRHVLPATVLLTLLCAYGLELLSQRFAGSRNLVMTAGSVCLLLLAAGPTVQSLRAGTLRYPYDRMEEAVLAREQSGTPAFAVWYYGVAEPINFYCKRTCVQQLPDGDAALPSRLLLLYRPSSKKEVSAYKRLLGEGYTDVDHTYFSDGLKTAYGTTAATLARSTR